MSVKYYNDKIRKITEICSVGREINSCLDGETQTHREREKRNHKINRPKARNVYTSCNIGHNRECVPGAILSYWAGHRFADSKGLTICVFKDVDKSDKNKQSQTEATA